MFRDPLYVQHVLAPRYNFDRRAMLPYLSDILAAHVLMLRRVRVLDLPPQPPRYKPSAG